MQITLDGNWCITRAAWIRARQTLALTLARPDKGMVVGHDIDASAVALLLGLASATANVPLRIDPRPLRALRRLGLVARQPHGEPRYALTPAGRQLTLWLGASAALREASAIVMAAQQRYSMGGQWNERTTF